MYKFKLLTLFIFVFSLNTSFAQDQITEGLKDIFGGVGKVIGGSLGFLGGYQPPQPAMDQTKMSGSCVNGSTNNFRYTDGSEYVGECNGDNRVGRGTLTWVTEERYIGDWVNNVRQGQGQQTFIKDKKTGVYNGDFLNDTLYGKGTLKWSDGETYAGDWVKNRRHGFGIGRNLNYGANGKGNYEGDWDKDVPINGIINYLNGTKYIGETKGAYRHGVGKYVDQYGDTYIGQWKDNERNGQGTFTWADGDRYVGEFLNGARHGQGTYFWAGGDRFVGQWRNNEKYGQGTLIYANGRTENQYW